MVYLYGCQSGRGIQGENVAWTIAKLTDARVRATDYKVSFTNVIVQGYQARVNHFLTRLNPWFTYMQIR